MESDTKTPSWWSQTKSVLFSPRAFFVELRGQVSYRSSAIYLVQTAFVVSLINTLVLTLMFYVIVAFFASILTAFIVVFGTLLTPLIAVAGNIPPEKVPGAVESFARNGGIEVAMLSARLGAFLFAAYFGTIVASTCLQSAIAHGIARLMGCAGTFRATAAAYSFGSAAWMLSIVPVAIVFAPIYGAALDIFGMRHVHNLSNAKSLFAVATAAALPAIAFVIYSSISN